MYVVSFHELVDEFYPYIPMSLSIETKLSSFFLFLFRGGISWVLVECKRPDLFQIL